MAQLSSLREKYFVIHFVTVCIVNILTDACIDQIVHSMDCYKPLPKTPCFLCIASFPAFYSLVTPGLNISQNTQSFALTDLPIYWCWAHCHIGFNCHKPEMLLHLLHWTIIDSMSQNCICFSNIFAEVNNILDLKFSLSINSKPFICSNGGVLTISYNLVNV